MLIQDANNLDKLYKNTSGELDSKYNTTSESQKRATALKARADKLAADTQDKYDKLKSE